MPNLPGMDAEGRLQRPGFLTNFGYEIIPPGEGLDDHEFLENPASVLTITDDIDSPDPVSGEIDEAPV